MTVNSKYEAKFGQFSFKDFEINIQTNIDYDFVAEIHDILKWTNSEIIKKNLKITF